MLCRSLILSICHSACLNWARASCHGSQHMPGSDRQKGPLATWLSPSPGFYGLNEEGRYTFPFTSLIHSFSGMKEGRCTVKTIKCILFSVPILMRERHIFHSSFRTSSLAFFLLFHPTSPLPTRYLCLTFAYLICWLLVSMGPQP